MNISRFDKLVEDQIVDIRKTLASKGKKYGKDGDRLHNFKVAAGFDSKPNETPERAAWGMFRKHLVSVIDIIDNLDNDLLPDEHLLNEKIRDAVNYPILIKALIVERIEERVEIERVCIPSSLFN